MAELLEAREVATVLLGDLGQVVADHPQLLADLGVEGDDHDRAARDASQLTHARLGVGVPVVNGEDRQGGVDASVTEGQVGGVPAQRGRQMPGPLRGHHIAGLDRDHMPASRFV